MLPGEIWLQRETCKLFSTLVAESCCSALLWGLSSSSAVTLFLPGLETPVSDRWLLWELPGFAALLVCSLSRAAVQLGWPSTKAGLAQEILLTSHCARLASPDPEQP